MKLSSYTGSIRFDWRTHCPEAALLTLHAPLVRLQSFCDVSEYGGTSKSRLKRMGDINPRWEIGKFLQLHFAPRIRRTFNVSRFRDESRPIVNWLGGRLPISNLHYRYSETR